MHKVNYSKFIAMIVCLVSCIYLQAQNEISTPYSKYGYGLPSNITSGAYNALGKVGYALQDPYLINFKNPASYVAFDSLSFIADASFTIYSSTLKTTQAAQVATYARPDYLTLGLPVTKHWRTSAGILPFSNLGYSIIDKRTDATTGCPIEYNYAGDGGLLQLYWGNAFKICKGLSIGFNISYLFGTLTYTKSATFDGSNFFGSMVNNTVLVDGIHYSAGAQYFVNIKNKHRLGFGVVYENSAYVWTQQKEFVYNYTSTGTITNFNDTVTCTDQKGNLKIPQKIGGGISYQFKDKILVSADVAWQNWKQLYLTGYRTGNMQDAITVNAGLQFIADATSTNYLKKIRFRIGGQYSTGQIFVNDTSIRDFSVSIGFGFPLKIYNNNPSLGFMFEYGQMGTIKNQLLKENYFKFSLHFTLQERWYQRVKLE